MNYSKISIYSCRSMVVVVLTVIITLLFVSIITIASLDNENLPKKYNLYHSKLMNYSSLASRLKLSAITNSNVDKYSNENINNILSALFIENLTSFEIVYSSPGYTSVKVESIKFSKLIDTIYLLIQDERVEISTINIIFDKINGNVSCYFTILGGLS